MADVKAGRRSVNGRAVQAAAPRLCRAGIEIACAAGDIPAAHILYGQLGEEVGDAAHSRYNAILARVIDFCVAAECAKRAARIEGPKQRRTFPRNMKRDESTATEVAEAVRVKRLREDARRSISVNLAETIALSHALLKMADAAQRRRGSRTGP